MNPEMTFFFYLLIGIAVAIALWLRRDERISLIDLFQIVSAPVFWPIYLPALLATRGEKVTSSNASFPKVGSRGVNDSLNMAITQVERELDTALHSLEGWAEDVLAEEQHRIAELKTAWRQQADHIRELDRLLTQTATKTPLLTPQSAGDPFPTPMDASMEQQSESFTPDLPSQKPDTRSAEHERIRAENITRLTQLRRSMVDDLMATVAWVRELVTMIHLAKFTGAPASRAQELVKQIASAVKGLAEVTRPTPNPSH